jgi:hypothetical protein
MKLSVSINLFDGEELLLPMLRSIRKEVDHVSIIYQETSYVGLQCSENLFRVLEILKNEKLVDEFYKYEIEKYKNDVHFQVHESRKRNIGLSKARNWGATHFISLDADEFLQREVLVQAKREVAENDYDATACKLIDYWISPRYQVPGFGRAFGDFLHVPLIYKIKDNIHFTHKELEGIYYCIADTTRKIEGSNCHKFGDHIFVHHMTTVRSARFGIESKFKNRSSYIPPVLPPENIADLFLSWSPGKSWGPKVDIVDDIFSIAEAFIEQNLVSSDSNSKIVIVDVDVEGAFSFSGAEIENERDFYLDLYKYLCELIDHIEKQNIVKITSMFSEYCRDKKEIIQTIGKYRKYSSYKLIINTFTIRKTKRGYVSSCVASWVDAGGRGRKGTLRTDTNPDHHLAELGMSAVMVDGGGWELTGFQELW